MYKRVDSENPPLPDTDLFIKTLETEDYKKASQLFSNSFSCVWQSDLKEKIKDLGADAVSLSGSGPTWFGYYLNKKEAVSAYKTLKSSGVECYIAKPCNFAISQNNQIITSM